MEDKQTEKQLVCVSERERQSERGRKKTDEKGGRSQKRLHLQKVRGSRDRRGGNELRSGGGSRSPFRSRGQ